MGIGMGEVILFMCGVIGVIFPAFYFLAKYLTVIGGKTCPHCAEKTKGLRKFVATAIWT
jgi:hypothetical protein